MGNIFLVLALICLAGVMATLIFGVFAMAKEGEDARKRSNKFMRLRVVLQGLTVFFLLLAWLAR